MIVYQILEKIRWFVQEKKKEKRGYREQKEIFDHKDYQIQGKVSVELFGLDFDWK